MKRSAWVVVGLVVTVLGGFWLWFTAAPTRGNTPAPFTDGSVTQPIAADAAFDNPQGRRWLRAQPAHWRAFVLNH